MNQITCPVCKSAKIKNQLGTHDSLFECDNGHSWDISDGRWYVLGGAINLVPGTWLLVTNRGRVTIQLGSRAMIESVRLDLTRHFNDNDVTISKGRRTGI